MAKYVGRYVCVSCKVPLNFEQVSGNMGVCPHCGHISTGSFCDVEKTAVLAKERFSDKLFSTILMIGGIGLVVIMVQILIILVGYAIP